MKLMLDNTCFNSKPTGKDASNLTFKLMKNPIEINVKDLAQELIKGKTFTPAYFKEKGGEIKRQKAYWYSQQIIALDFDEGMTLYEAINTFKESAMFIYTTFSHTEENNKFRVVFALDKPTYNIYEIEQTLVELMKMYPDADPQCKDCTRLFYGGKKLYELNYNNRLKVEDFEIEVFSGTKENILIYPAENTKQQKNSRNILTNSNTAMNIQLIKQKDIVRLQEVISPEPKVVHNVFELFDYLKQQDLRLYIGIASQNNFIDIFHHEENPSASIFDSNKNNGHQLYKCFSKSHPFTGTILQITQKLLGCSILEVKRFLIELYKIEIVESEAQKELKLAIDTYKELLQSEDLEELYPNFYKLFSRYGYLKDLYILLDLVKEYLPTGDDPRLLFHHSIDTIARKFGRSRSVTHTRINHFTFFELIVKLDVDDIPSELLSIQRKRKKEKKHKYLNSTYELPLYNYDFFAELDSVCAIWIEKGCTSKTVNYEGIMRNFGVEEADRVFPQDKGKVIPPLNEEVVSRIHRTTLELIANNGWTTEQEVLENIILYFNGQQVFKQKQFKICFGELLDSYDLERIRLNKELKQEMGIEGNGYGYIIRHKKYGLVSVYQEVKNTMEFSINNR